AFKAPEVCAEDQARQPRHAIFARRMDGGSGAGWRRISRRWNRQRRNFGDSGGGRQQVPRRRQPARADIECQWKGVRARQGVPVDSVSVRLLAMDTTGETGSIALLDDGKVLEEVTLHSPEGFAHTLFPAIEQLLER